MDALAYFGLYVNLAYKLVICLKCSEDLNHDHIHRHISWHFLPCPSANKLATILKELDLMKPPPIFSSCVVAPISNLHGWWFYVLCWVKKFCLWLPSLCTIICFPLSWKRSRLCSSRCGTMSKAWTSFYENIFILQKGRSLLIPTTWK